MAISSSRVVLRHTRLTLRQCNLRHNSTTAQAADKASEVAAKAQSAASTATSKASEGLSRVTSSAGPALSGAARGVGNALGRVGGRTGRLISFVESMIPPTIHYSRVGLELAKIVFRGQKMSPPPVATFQSYTQPLLAALKNPARLFSQTTNSTSALQPIHLLHQVRNVSRQHMVTAGVVTAEVIGFFSVGEMVGRMKLVGYRGDKEVHH